MKDQELTQYAQECVNAFQLGQEFAKRIRVGKRFFGSMPIAKKLYGSCDTHEANAFIAGYWSVTKNISILIRPQTGLVSGFGDETGRLKLKNNF